MQYMIPIVPYSFFKMFFLVSLLSVPFLIIFFLLFEHKRSRQHCLPPPPGPKGLPFIGNIHQMDMSNFPLWLTNLSKKYGPLVHFRIFQTPVIVISSADAAENALKLNDLAFSGRPCTREVFRFTYGQNDIICSSYTEYWREMRKMVVLHLFSPQKVRSFRPTREEEVCRLINQISDKANSGQLINLGEVATWFASNLLLRVAFGKRMTEEEEKEGSHKIDRMLKKLVAIIIQSISYDYLPIFLWIKKVLGLPDEVGNLYQELDSFYQQLIDEHLSRNRSDSMDNDILDLLIQLKDDSSAPVKIDWKHIKGILLNVIGAGIDTNATTIIWALTALMRNPSVMKTVQQEIRSSVGNKRSVNEDDIKKLPYLKAVIKETWRLFPPIPVAPKETIEQCNISGYEIKQKTLVLLNVWGIGRDPEYWENPDEFLPDRFLNTTINFNGQDFEYLPFGSGRRVCPGLNLAVATAELVLANLLYCFDWEIPHGMTEEYIDTEASIGLVMHKKNPLHLMVKSYI